MGKFWEGLSGEAGKDWLAKLQTPAFLFWAIGAILFLWQTWGVDLPKKLQDWVTSVPVSELAALLAAILTLVIVSGWIVERLSFSLLRLHEGYWPQFMSCLLALRIDRHKDRYKRRKKERDALLDTRDKRPLSPVENLRLSFLEDGLREFPDEPEIMGTRLGNILRAAETRPRLKYGLDAVICWPRFWLLLPSDIRSELASARDSLDGAAQLWLWGFLLVIWSFLTWKILIAAALWCWICWFAMCSSARVYGDLLEAAFDVKRGLLYEALSWPQPKNPSEERGLGEAMTSYLQYGSTSAEPIFARAEKKKTNDVT